MKPLEVMQLCALRGVTLVITGQEPRARGRKGAVSDALRVGLADHEQDLIGLLGDGLFPDPTLPETIRVPADAPNTAEAIRACVDAQKARAA